MFPPNDRKLEAVSLQTNDQGTTLTAKIQGVEQRIACGRGTWRPGRFAFGPLLDQPAAASGAWTEDDTFTAKICFYETPFILKVKLKFNGGIVRRFRNECRLRSDQNVDVGGKGGVRFMTLAIETHQLTRDFNDFRGERH